MELRVMRLILIALMIANVLLVGCIVFVRIVWKEKAFNIQPVPTPGRLAAPNTALPPEDLETQKTREELKTETLAMLQEQINVLKKESTQESLARLSEPTMFDFTTRFAGRYPSSIAYEMPPVDDQEARRDLVRILCNRRVVKLLEELQVMPKTEAAALVLKHLEESFDRYRQQLTKGSQTNNNALNIETLRLNLEALVIIAGNLELTETSEILHSIAEFALEQREKAYKQTKQGALEMISANNTLVRASLYNRIVLGTGLLGVGGAVSQSEDYPWTELELAPYDSLVSPIDPPALRGDIIPDYSRTRIKIRHLKTLPDEGFDTILGVERTAL